VLPKKRFFAKNIDILLPQKNVNGSLWLVLDDQHWLKKVN